ncbi:Hypothetical protein Cul210932_1073 [Corynebacterium ulcerans]|nr:Hypothetical protein Cul210932_1073 [Corynebacterium ulcerans]
MKTAQPGEARGRLSKNKGRNTIFSYTYFSLGPPLFDL